jgi:hypothetical protein|tara:strand:- start:1052 stop:1225 length:174 start_codon:yes stop_codon:yes gene_type:complete
MKYSNVVILLFLILFLTACGGGGGSPGSIINDPNPGIPSDAEQTLSEIDEALDDLGL